ncbi:MAG: DUF6265 family protein [Pseudomonadota bacterium]
MKKLVFSGALLMLIPLPVAQASEPISPFFDWFTGCWVSEDGAMREVWSAMEGDLLFGYSVNIDLDQDRYPGQQVTFFEQMRIDLFEDADHPPAFYAYPAGQGPTRFVQTDFGDRTVTYENASNDFPQRIRYWRDGAQLKAEISTLDDSSIRRFTFLPCSEN